MKIVFFLFTRMSFKSISEYVYIFSYILAFAFFSIFDIIIIERTVVYAYIVMQLIDCYLPLRPVQSIVPLFAPRSALNRWFMNFLFDSLTPSVVVLYALFNIYGMISGYSIVYYAIILALHILMYSVRVYLGYNNISPIPILLLSISVWALLYHNVYLFLISTPFILAYLIYNQSDLIDTSNTKKLYIKGFSFYQRDSVMNAVGVASILTIYWFISSLIGLEYVGEYFESATMMLILSPIVYFAFIYNNYFGYYREMWYEYQLVYYNWDLLKKISLIVLPLLLLDYCLKMISIYIFSDSTIGDIVMLSKYYIFFSAAYVIISYYSCQIHPKYIPEKLLDKRGGLLSSLSFLALCIVFVIGSKYNIVVTTVAMLLTFTFLRKYVNKRQYELHYRAVRTLRI